MPEPDNLARIVAHLERAWENQRVARITPSTALKLAACARFYLRTAPTRDEIAHAICHVDGKCGSRCMSCTGHANAVLRLLEGRE